MQNLSCENEFRTSPHFETGAWCNSEMAYGFPRTNQSTNQKHYPELNSNTSSVWNFCARSSDVISRETSGDVGKGRLFSQATINGVRNHFSDVSVTTTQYKLAFRTFRALTFAINKITLFCLTCLFSRLETSNVVIPRTVGCCVSPHGFVSGKCKCILHVQL